MLVVVALGGNALLRRGEAIGAEIQRRNIAAAADAISEIAQQHRLVVTHGNGPQIGLLAEAPSGHRKGETFPLDVLGAESQGMIGYEIESELSARLPAHEIATLLTQTVVDANDPAFANPTKPIGRVYPEPVAHQLQTDFGWTLVADGGGFRRAVPSPSPRRIRETNAIRLLVDAGVIVICAGGGGVPVTIDALSGRVTGVEAVIDKDRTAALLACKLHADALLILTDVPAVYTGWGTPSARAICHANPAGLSRYRFAEGSMGPKVEAACAFVAATGGFAGIGALSDAAALLRGDRGTRIATTGAELDWY
jgi:carbamate kinase